MARRRHGRPVHALARHRHAAPEALQGRPAQTAPVRVRLLPAAVGSARRAAAGRGGDDRARRRRRAQQRRVGGGGGAGPGGGRRCLELFAETKRGTADELRALSDNLLSAVACDKAYPAAFSMTTLALWKFGEAAGGVKGADIARYLLREVFGNPFHPVAVARH